MRKRGKEIARRTASALAVIKQSLSEEDSAVSLFASHHIEELDAAYWKKHARTAKPTPKQVVDLLELRSHWGDEDEDGIDTFDFTLPGDVTDYVVSVRFGGDGEVEELSMKLTASRLTRHYEGLLVKRSFPMLLRGPRQVRVGPLFEVTDVAFNFSASGRHSILQRHAPAGSFQMAE
jgi:hypothetical protein